MGQADGLADGSRVVRERNEWLWKYVIGQEMFRFLHVTTTHYFVFAFLPGEAVSVVMSLQNQGIRETKEHVRVTMPAKHKPRVNQKREVENGSRLVHPPLLATPSSILFSVVAVKGLAAMAAVSSQRGALGVILLGLSDCYNISEITISVVSRVD